MNLVWWLGLDGGWLGMGVFVDLVLFDFDVFFIMDRFKLLLKFKNIFFDEVWM